MNKTEEQSGMTMEQMEEAGKIEEKKRDAEAAVAQSEAASKKRREGKRVRVPVRFKKPLDSSSPNYRNLTLAMERDGFAEPLVEGSYPSFEVLIYEDDLELLDNHYDCWGLLLELLLKAIREANPGCFVTGKQVHGKVQDPMMKVFRVLCVVRARQCGHRSWRVAGRFCRGAVGAVRECAWQDGHRAAAGWLQIGGRRDAVVCDERSHRPDQIKLKDRDLDSGRWDGASSSASRPTRLVVVCLADVSLSPGWTECFASEVGPRLILRISDIWPLRCLSDRLVRWKILLWDVADAARSWERKLLGMWPLILLRLVKGSLVIVLSFPGMGLMGAPMPASAQNLRMNGQLWTTSEGLVVTLGPVKGSTVKPGPLNTRSGSCGCWKRGAAGLQRVEDNLAKMWQANLTEYEENPMGTTSRRRKTRRGQPQKEENPAVGDNLKGHRWATPAGWGMDTMEENPKKGDNLKKENPTLGKPRWWDGGRCRGWECGTGWRHRGHTTLAQVDGAGFLLLTTPLSFGSALGTGRFGRETGSDIMVASDNVRLGDLEEKLVLPSLAYLPYSRIFSAVHSSGFLKVTL
ncbi:hypothetical protein PAPYR_10442 [Paratrimastix pyriformis]|uniref:Uncharacterized protein n=1 Tax=Paratrimastix pyriformis TaxID=342808 RepID=A0ABQ8UD40_9EUKA|nr:hypothetical protein PAPYR_10442 [Paratrimastix pyriformis]